MAETTKMILLVGMYPDEEGFVVAGAYDAGIADIVGADDYDKAIDKMKRAYDPDLTFGYTWREIIVSLNDDDLKPYFVKPEVPATIEGLDPYGQSNPQTVNELGETLRGEHEQLD